VNDLVGIKAPNTMCHTLFYEPFMTCCFIDDKTIFVSLFENYSLTHYHFFFDLDTRKVIGKICTMPMKGKMDNTNFPIKNFYNEDLKEVYCFYRHGDNFIINISEGIA
jgi:hypothetical protein